MSKRATHTHLPNPPLTQSQRTGRGQPYLVVTALRRGVTQGDDEVDVRETEASRRTCFQHQQRPTPSHDFTTKMHAQRLQSLLGAALIFFNVTEAFVLSRSPLLPSISRSPCSRTGTSTTSKRSVAFQDNQHPRKSQQSHAKDADDILAVLEGKFYQWKHGPVHYVEAGGETAAAEAFPVLLLPGEMTSEKECKGMTTIKM